ncbi:MAG: DUF1214 domain-containing protein [Sphingomonadaceae bacterium]
MAVRGWLIGGGLVAALGLAGFLFWRGPVADTTEAALRAFPVYSFVRTRNEQLLRIAHVLGEETDAARPRGLGLLVHRDSLATPRDRAVTTPNNDTLYSTAFVSFGDGWTIDIPAVEDRYVSVAVMDANTDHAVVAGTRDGTQSPQRLTLAHGPGCKASSGDEAATRTICVPTDEAWILVRVEAKGPDDLDAARAVQRAISLGPAPPGAAAAPAPAIEPVLLPAVPDPAMLLRRANPVIARNPTLADERLAATGYGQGAQAFDALPAWRQWLWRLLWPRIVERMKTGISAGSRVTGDGWSRSPPGIGTAAATPAVRAAVALGGLAALPADEAVYWSATVDSQGRELDGANRYRLRIPEPVPADAFWSLTLYQRLPDGRLFFIDNPLDRYAIGNRTPGLVRDADGTLSITLAAADPGQGAIWLPMPQAGPFTLVFRAYRPQAPIRDGKWRLPPVERLP